MNNTNIQKIIGSVIIVSLLGWFVYSMFFKPEEGMHIIVEAENAAGLEPDNSVNAQGFQIGTVESMRLKQDFSGKVLINILLKSDLALPKDSIIAVITDADLMGTKMVDLVYTNQYCKNCLSNYDTIYSQTGSYFDTEINELEPFMSLIEQTYETLDTAVKSWKNQNIGDYDAKMREAERDIKEMMANFTTATNNATTLMKTTTTSFGRISKDAESVMANFEGETMKQIQADVVTIQKNFEKANFDQTSDNVEKALKKWNTTLEKITLTQEILAAITKKMEKGQTGSLAQILNDPRFQSEEDANSKPLNLNYSKLLEDIRLHPEKYTHLIGKKEKK